MVSKKLVKALNEHINLEMYSGYLYLAMSIKTHEENYKGYSSSSTKKSLNILMTLFILCSSEICLLN